MLNDSGATVSDGVYVARIVVRTADGKKDHTYCKIVKLK